MFSTTAIIIIFLAIVFSAVIIGMYFYPMMFLVEPSTATITTTTLTTYNASSDFEISPGASVILEMVIDSQNFSVKASNNIFPIFGVAFTPPSVSFTDACKIARRAANLNKFDEIKLGYEAEKMFYTVSGQAKDSFSGFEVENTRVVSIAGDGTVKSISKEPLFISFMKKLFVSTLKSWKQ